MTSHNQDKDNNQGGADFKYDDKNDNEDDDEDKDRGEVLAVSGRVGKPYVFGCLCGRGGVHSNNNDNDVINRNDDHKDDYNNFNTQQPTLWLDAFQTERAWGEFDDNNDVKDNEDEPQQGQGQQSGRGGGFQI